MKKETQKKKIKNEEENLAVAKDICKDERCPFHGSLRTRGKTFQGTVIKKFPKRVVVSFEQTKYVRKYERYRKTRTKIHARLPDCLSEQINLGDLIKITECRPLSKIIHFVVVGKINSGEKNEIK